MRNELEYLAEIEAYVMGTIDNKSAFENRMANSGQLRQDVRMLKNIISTTKSQTLKKEVRNARHSYFLSKTLTWLVLAVVGLGIIAGISYWAQQKAPTVVDTQTQAAPSVFESTPTISDANPSIENNQTTTKNDSLITSRSNTAQLAIVTEEVLKESNATKIIEAGSALPLSNYSLNGLKNEVIETPNGIIFSIPKGSFEDANGNTVTDGYDIEIKEAIQAADIIKAGLSTWNYDNLLETGGMFHFSALKNGEELSIKKDANITASIPKLSNDVTGMNLYEGIRKGNGEINWINPKPPMEYLETTLMSRLNFYPPNYEAMLSEIGYKNLSKELKDSIYMSFSAQLGVKQDIKEEKTEVRKNYKDIDLGFFKVPVKRLEDKAVTTPADTLTTVQLGINPITVLSFWNSAFDGSILSTTDFERRMRIIHTTCSEDVLNCYIKNLNKSLQYCDSLALKKIVNGKTREAFMNFYYEKNKKLPAKTQFTDELLALFAKKQQELNAVFEKTSLITLQNIQKQKNEEAEQKNGYISQEIKKSNEAVREAMCEMSKALNKPCQKLVSPVAMANYNNFRIGKGGWYNVDRVFVMNAMSKSTKFEGNQTDITVSFEDDKYDLVEAYLIPEEKYSFLKMKKLETSFIYKFTYPMRYNMIVVAYKNNQPYAQTFEDVKPNTRHVAFLSPTSNEDIQAFISPKESISEDVSYEMENLMEKAKQNNIKRQYRSIENVIERLKPIIFPCASVEGSKQYLNEDRTRPKRNAVR